MKIEIYICSENGNHVDIPVLGQDFLKSIAAKVEVDYMELTAKIFRHK